MRSILATVVMLGFGLSAASAHGQIVQLPTFQYFSVGTTVVVPDRGWTYLGGVDRASYSSSRSGVPGLSHLPGAGRLFGNRGIGSEVSSSRAYAGATIMDLGELDRAVLAEAAARRGDGGAALGAGGTRDPAIERKAAFLSKHISRTDHLPPRPSSRPRRQ